MKVIDVIEKQGKDYPWCWLSWNFLAVLSNHLGYLFAEKVCLCIVGAYSAMWLISRCLRREKEVRGDN